MSHTKPKDLTSTEAKLETSPRFLKAVKAKEVRKNRHQKIRPQTDLRRIT